MGGRVAIVAAAGGGKRLGLSTEKPFVMLEGMPLITYSLRVLGSSNAIDEIIVAVDRSCISRFKGIVKRYKLKKIKYVVAGGRSRFESVRNCLKMVGASCRIVLIHDAARPFLDDRMIRESIRTAATFGGAVVALPESDTVKRVGKDLFIDKTVERSDLWRAQTPQAFRRSLIVDAYLKHPVNSSKITDDSCLAENLGKKVKIVDGSYKNIKITTRDDLLLAKALLRGRPPKGHPLA